MPTSMQRHDVDATLYKRHMAAGLSCSLRCPSDETVSLAVQNSPSEDSDQTANAQADLNLCYCT